MNLRGQAMKKASTLRRTESAIGNSVSVRSPSAAGRLVARVQSRGSRTLVAAVAPAEWFRLAGRRPWRWFSGAWPGAARRPALVLRTMARRRPSGGVLREPPRPGSSGQGDVQPQVAEAPFDQGLDPSADAEGTQRCQLGRAGRPAHELALAERAHQQDAEAEFVGQQQDGALDLPVRRKVAADASSAGNQIAAVQMG